MPRGCDITAGGSGRERGLPADLLCAGCHRAALGAGRLCWPGAANRRRTGRRGGAAPRLDADPRDVCPSFCYMPADCYCLPCWVAFHLPSCCYVFSVSLHIVGKVLPTGEIDES
eukprot:2449157-Pleurochrysis_carterae.AAC.2